MTEAKTVTVYIPQHPSVETDPVVVTVNGKVLARIPVGKDTEVPEAALVVLDDSGIRYRMVDGGGTLVGFGAAAPGSSAHETAIDNQDEDEAHPDRAQAEAQAEAEPEPKRQADAAEVAKAKKNDAEKAKFDAGKAKTDK